MPASFSPGPTARTVVDRPVIVFDLVTDLTEGQIPVQRLDMAKVRALYEAECTAQGFTYADRSEYEWMFGPAVDPSQQAFPGGPEAYDDAWQSVHDAISHSQIDACRNEITDEQWAKAVANEASQALVKIALQVTGIADTMCTPGLDHIAGAVAHLGRYIASMAIGVSNYANANTTTDPVGGES